MLFIFRDWLLNKIHVSLFRLHIYWYGIMACIVMTWIFLIAPNGKLLLSKIQRALKLDRDIHFKLLDRFELKQEKDETEDEFAHRCKAADLAINSMQVRRDELLEILPYNTKWFCRSDVLEYHLFNLEEGILSEEEDDE